MSSQTFVGGKVTGLCWTGWNFWKIKGLLFVCKYLFIYFEGSRGRGESLSQRTGRDKGGGSGEWAISWVTLSWLVLHSFLRGRRNLLSSEDSESHKKEHRDDKNKEIYFINDPAKNDVSSQPFLTDWVQLCVKLVIQNGSSAGSRKDCMPGLSTWKVRRLTKRKRRPRRTNGQPGTQQILFYWDNAWKKLVHWYFLWTF